MAHPVPTQLDLVEQQFQQVAAFLARGDAPEVQNGMALLQSQGQQLAQLISTHPLPSGRHTALHQRVARLAAGMQMLRDTLLRQAAMNQQALQVLVPTPPKSTYSGGSSVYGSVARQSGAFKVLAA